VATAEPLAEAGAAPIAAPFPPAAMPGATTPRAGSGLTPTGVVVVTVVLLVPAGVEVVVTVRTAVRLAGFGVGVVTAAGFAGAGFATGTAGTGLGAGFGGVVVFVVLGCVTWEVVCAHTETHAIDTSRTNVAMQNLTERSIMEVSLSLKVSRLSPCHCAAVSSTACDLFRARLQID
jgi:hypothetical protein